MDGPFAHHPLWPELMTDIDPTVRPDPLPEDADRALRPQMLTEFVGQAEARANLSVFIQSARQRGEAMDLSLIQT